MASERLDRDVFQDCDFAASEPTNIPIPRLDDGQGESEGEGEDEHHSSDLDEADTNQTTANVTAESHDVVDPVITVQPSIPGSAEQHDHRHDHQAKSVTCAPAETPCQSHFAAELSTSTAGHVAIIPVFCPGFQKSRVPSEKGTFSAVNAPSKGLH